MKKIWIFLLLISWCCAQEKVFEPTSLSGMADSGKFKLYKNESVLGVIDYKLDEKGNYERTFELSYAGQVITYKLSLTSDENGLWSTASIDVPGQKIGVQRKNNTATYHVNKTEKIVTLTDQHVAYDSYGPAFESFALKKYDKQKGGKQNISRFLIPAACMDVEIEYKGTQVRKVQEKEWTLQHFHMIISNIGIDIWAGQDFKIYMMNVPVQYVTYVRDGFEDLMKVKDEDPLLSKPTHDIKKETHMVPMRDGVKLATDIYFPKDVDKAPVILIRTPYKKEMEETKGNFYARRGYIVAVQDCRGRFASQGVWEPFINEEKDGHDVVEWLAVQPWSTKKIGMIGGSYVGWTQLWAAVSKPKHLTTIIPNVAPPDAFFNIPYEYGAFFIFGSIWWAQILEQNATADISGKVISDITKRDYQKDLMSLPVINLDKKLLGKENSYWRKWIKNNVNNEYWAKSNFMERLADLDIPVFLQSGWFDGDGIGSKLNYSYLRKSKNKHQKLVLGPWGHTDQATTSIGDVHFGKEAGLDLQTLYLRWFDYWLKGIDNKICDEPLVKVYLMFSNKWITGNDYPLPQTKFTKLFLSSSGKANTSKGDGELVWSEQKIQTTPDTYTYNPGDPTPSPDYPTEDEDDKSKKDEKEKSTDKNKDDKKEKENFHSKTVAKRQDILVYETEVLTKDISIAGPVAAKLYAATSAKDTDWFVTLVDIDEKGEALPLVKGVIRARFRQSMSQPVLLEKDTIYEYDIDMWQTGITFRKGHRIRVEIASAMFPLFSRNLNTGGHNEMDSEYVSAQQKIYHSQEYPSHIILPVIDK
ncbi:CocE/NonD family hydrolase [Candidatus Uabimicrobium amorphum]|uniref:Esterase n=1 Tax=Uabimicrobium amorphum TaxID=2596890 RepID=A0A5S9IRN8_UABAM|nr:CocE/NonD family hydrolase [Candidatus Uabimicrobium amorphum]BBM86477.1 esterase [Candidatus Uabimicrobium amorphum]